MQAKIITIVGPTASGKTKLAALLANRLKTEIISADSRQVYRGMDIGTGKDLADYNVNGQMQNYHLIDIVDPGYKYNLFEYQQDFRNCYSTLSDQYQTVILAGGTGMYIDSILRGYQLTEVAPQSDFRLHLEQFTNDQLIEQLATLRNLHNTTDTSSRKRLIRAIEIAHFDQNNELKMPCNALPMQIFGIYIDRDIRRERITKRLHQRLQSGLIEEAQQLINNGLSVDDLIFYGLEYKYLALYLIHKLTYKQMVEQLNIAIHQFAKRQMTWFRGMERRGEVINWIDGKLDPEEQLEQVLQIYQSN